MSFTEGLIKQYDSSWRMLEKAIDQVSENRWRIFEKEWGFVGNVYHIIETAEFYNRDSPEGFPWGKRANIDWEKDKKAKNYEEKFAKLSKDFIKGYMYEVKKNIEIKLKFLKEEGLLKKSEFHGGSENTIFDVYLYTLRHSMHHIGELNKTLRDNKEPRISWI